MQFPAPATDPRLAEVEGLRKAAKAKAVHYFIVEVDNSCGSQAVTIYGVNVNTADGDPVYEAEGVEESIAYYETNKGGPTPPYNAADRMSKTARRYYEQARISPGEQSTIIFDDWDRGPGVPAHVYVATGPDFITGVEARKVRSPNGSD